MTRTEAMALRLFIEEQAQTLPDEKALERKNLFPYWHNGTAYEPGIRVRYDGELYRCLQAHTAINEWNPADAISLWAKVLIPDPDVIPDWVQPDSTNPYMIGDKVRHNGKVWVSIIDYNVFEPGVAGWDEVVD